MLLLINWMENCMSGERHNELVNSLTHGLGVVLSIAAASVLIVLASTRGTVWHVVSCSIYSASMIALFLASTLYHGTRSPRLKRFFHILDHSAIYLLIAGTYTPFVLVTLRGPWGWTLFGIEWGLALCGIVFKSFFIERFSALSVIVYALMGWMIIVAIKPMIAHVPSLGLILVLAGGVAYTTGIIFYVWRRIPYSHGIWHSFVLCGGILQYFSIMVTVIPCATQLHCTLRCLML